MYVPELAVMAKIGTVSPVINAITANRGKKYFFHMNFSFDFPAYPCSQ